MCDTEDLKSILRNICLESVKVVVVVVWVMVLIV